MEKRCRDIVRHFSTGNGKCCPAYDRCKVRGKGVYCLQDNLENIYSLRGGNSTLAGFFKLGYNRGCRMLELVELLAQAYLEKAGISSPPVPEDIIYDKGIDIEVRKLPLKLFSGKVWWDCGKWVIYVNSCLSKETQRYIIFHEIFHILTVVYTYEMPERLQDKNGAFNDLLADHFAGCVIIPRKWMQENWDRIRDTSKIAAICQAPEGIAVGAAIGTGLIKAELT